jgi:phosphoribosylamine---glycine ligase
VRLLIVDPQGNGLDFALRAQRDGHDVRLGIRITEKTKNIGKGLVQVVEDYRKWVRWADVVFCTDNAKYVHDLDRWRQEGVKVIGATIESAQWELNRSAGMKVMEKAGIKIPAYKEFRDYDSAINFVKREDRRFVSKVIDGSVEDKSLSYCAKSPEDMVYMLQRWKKLHKLMGPFVLQDFIPGIEMAVGGWHGRGGFRAGWCENWEFKKLMNDDLGVATGEQGTILRYVRASKLARKVLQPLEEALERLNYIGYIDVNCIVDEQGTPWPLEFTMRPGWPTFNIQMAVHEGDHAQWLLDLYTTRDSRCWVMNAVAAGVVVSIPDYPYSHMTRKEVTGVPVYGVRQEDWEHVHPCEMMMGFAPRKLAGKFADVPMMVTAGDYVLVMSGTGHDVRTATDSVYRRLKTLVVPNSPMYRTDIGRRLKKQLPQLQAMGYAMDMGYSTPPLSLSA